MILQLQVKPNSKKESICFDDLGKLRIKIRAQPVEGKANKYLLKYLSEIFKLPQSKIRILKGEVNTYKIIELDAPEEYINTVLKSLGKE